METTIWTISGVLGFVLYLTAYGALQLGFLRGTSPVYTILNMVAAGFVLISLVEAFNLSAFLTSVFWIIFSIIGLTRMAIQRNRARFDDTETAFLSAHFATLPPHMARRLLSLGTWQNVSPGTVLTRQGSPVQHLSYFASGAARVSAHGADVAQLGPGALVGEITVMHGANATADVEVTQPAHIFTLPRDALNRELESDHEFALAVSRALQIEAQRKIETANRATAAAAS